MILQDIYLSTTMMTSEQVSSYVQFELSSFSPQTLQVGIENNIVGHDSFSSGKYNIVGANGYNIISSNGIYEGQVMVCVEYTVDCEDKSRIDDRLSVLRPSYSVNAPLPLGNIGSVLSINTTYDKIIVDAVFFNENNKKEYGNPQYIVGKSIYFEEYPTIGNIGFASGEDSIAIGLNNRTFADCSQSFGRNNVTNGSYGHAEGKNNVAQWACHAEGCANRSLGACSHAEGRLTKAQNASDHTQGCATVSDSSMGFAGGFMGHSKDAISFVWNGTSDISGYQGNRNRKYPTNVGQWKLDDSLESNDLNAMDCLDASLSDFYKSHGVGTFNVNPNGGLSGLFIGNQSLFEHICNVASQLIHVELENTMDKFKYVKYTKNGNQNFIYVTDIYNNEWKYQTGTNIDRNLESLDHLNRNVNYASSCFYRCQTLSSIGDGNQMTCINDHVFYDNRRLSSLYFPNVRTIGKYAFSLTDIKEISCPELLSAYEAAFQSTREISSMSFDKLQYVGVATFDDCKKLEKLSIPNVIFMDQLGIRRCPLLREIDFSERTVDSIPTLSRTNSINLSELPSLTSIYVPQRLLETWKNTGLWTNYVNILKTK